MAAPSEEDRRLLREYRIITVPPRRSSCLPTTLNTSSSTTTATTTPTITTPTTKASPTVKNHVDSKQQDQQTKESQQIKQPNPILQPIRATHDQKTPRPQQHHINNHHHHHHHHHSSNHKRHKNTATSITHQVSVDELNRMLELVSGLDYLKLVAPKPVNVTPSSPSQQPIPTQTTPTAPKAITKNVNQIQVVTNGNDPKLPYIFEKVDYIKKISIRRKALKKSRRAKNRAFSSNNNNNGSNNKLKKKDSLARTNGAN